MASLFSRIGKPAPNFTSAGNPAGQMRSQWGDMSAAQRMGQRMRTPSMGYQPPGLQQGGTPLARPPQSPPNLGGGQQSPMGGGFAPAPAGSVRLGDGSLSTYSGPGPSGFAIPSTGQRPPPNPMGGGSGGRHPQRKPAGTGIVKRLFSTPQKPTRPFKRWNPNEFQAQW